MTTLFWPYHDSPIAPTMISAVSPSTHGRRVKRRDGLRSTKGSTMSKTISSVGPMIVANSDAAWTIHGGSEPTMSTSA